MTEKQSEQKQLLRAVFVPIKGQSTPIKQEHFRKNDDVSTHFSRNIHKLATCYSQPQTHHTNLILLPRGPLKLKRI